jgi:hypothetical protein
MGCIVLSGSWNQASLLYLVEFCRLGQYSLKCELNCIFYLFEFCMLSIVMFVKFIRLLNLQLGEYRICCHLTAVDHPKLIQVTCSVVSLQVLHLHIFLGIQDLLCFWFHDAGVVYSDHRHCLCDDCLHVFLVEC